MPDLCDRTEAKESWPVTKMGRNEPCPCGSGKKYKSCCWGRPLDPGARLGPGEEKPAKDDSFEAMDLLSRYGECDLSNPDIDAGHLHDLSAPRLLYSMLLSPGIGNAVSAIVGRFLDRGREEAERIREAVTISQLIELLRQGPDSINHELIVSRLVSFGPRATERILREYEAPVNDAVAELGVQVLYRSGLDCNDRLKTLIEKGPRKAYPISLLCMLLGFTATAEDATLLWGYYRFFKDRFAKESYSDGPLLGLLELQERLTQGNR